MQALRLQNMITAVAVATALATLLPALAGAEQVKRFGAYMVHYNAFTTDTLTQSVAQRYGLIRSTNRALLNISVLKEAEAVKAEVTATATNLNGQERQLELQELVEQGAIYYIAEMPVGNEEVYTYALKITPQGEGEPLAFQFRQQFFTN